MDIKLGRRYRLSRESGYISNIILEIVKIGNDYLECRVVRNDGLMWAWNVGEVVPLMHHTITEVFRPAFDNSEQPEKKALSELI